MTRQSVLAFVDQTAAGAIREALENRNLAGEVCEGNIFTALDDVDNWSVVPEFIILDITGVENAVDALQKLAERAPSGDTNVIIIGADNDVDIYRRLRSVGAAEYIVSPVKTSDVENAFTEILQNRLDRGYVVDPDKVIVVHGVRGGAGASTVASSVAHTISQEHGKNTLLLDLDIEAGCHYVELGIDPTQGLSEMFEAADRQIDAVSLDRTITKVMPRLSILSGYNQIMSVEASPGILEQILLQAQRSFDVILIDLPARPVITRQALLYAGHNILVAPPTILGLRDTAHTINYLDHRRHQGDLSIVINKINEPGVAVVGESAFRKRIPHRIHALPYDPKSVGSAYTNSEPLSSAGGVIKKRLHRFLTDLPTAPSAPRAKPLFGGLFGGGR